MLPISTRPSSATSPRSIRGDHVARFRHRGLSRVDGHHGRQPEQLGRDLDHPELIGADPVHVRAAETHAASKTGSRDVVAQQMMSDSRTAASDRVRRLDPDAGELGHPLRERLPRARVPGEDERAPDRPGGEHRAQICHSAWAPAPMSATVEASGRASSRVATPDAAPVRIAVSVSPSISASGLPVSASSQTTRA